MSISAFQLPFAENRFQRLMDSREILFEKTLILTVPYEYVVIITISANPSNVSSKIHVRITPSPRISPLIITFPGPVPYSSDKVVPWNYGADIYYHGVKQYLKIEEADPDVSNIVRTSKVTRSGRVFSPEIFPKIVVKPVIIPSVVHIGTSATTLILTPIVTPTIESSGTRGKEAIGEPSRTEVPRKVVVESSKQEILKIIKKSDYNTVVGSGLTVL